MLQMPNQPLGSFHAAHLDLPHATLAVKDAQLGDFFWKYSEVIDNT
jgi:hypothetical protein